MNDAVAPPDLTKAYDPKEVETRWYDFWEKNGVFAANEDPNDHRPVYVCPMPPPNVTGSLHMGHALFCTLQDVMTRWHRMRGFNTLWQPGMDHAGIATQTVVERQLARDGKTRFDIGREAFEKRIWEWKGESGGNIARQQRVLGSSADWPRSKFTMDPDMSHAVREAFVRLHEQGLMYRATRLINWDPVLLTSLSDLEVDHEETNGELFEFAYAVVGSEEEIVVATTRPETMLGDTAVAVHPEDPRYLHLHGKKLRHPFLDRQIPIVTDAILVDPKFGTGAVKVTPAHDFNDFATGKRHNLEEISIFNLDGTVNENGGRFQGLTRERARTGVKKALDELGLARGSKPHRLTVPKSQRSGVVVEPMISTQWFLKMGDMAKRALDAVHKGDVTILPEEWTKTYEHFLENIQDWCVSRQLWWGHQIPAWHGPNGEVRVAREKPEECNGEGWTQDPDVLDTWFSSALWPFATQGWPEKTPALAKFYPAHDLETGYDILFFWVARMIMFGLHFTDSVPFKRVLLHGLIVDETGDKMSKVKGNVIDPLDLIYGAEFKDMVAKSLPGAPEAEALAKFKKAYPSAATMGSGFPAFGTDALRFTLATYPPSNKRIALAPKRLEGYRHFLNKIWNASRLVLELAEGNEVPERAPAAKGFFNQWVLGKLSDAARICSAGIAAFRIDEAATEAYRFFWDDVCAWYLEVAKGIVRDGAGSDLANETKATLLYVLEASLKLLHPITPYVTEELWQRLPHSKAAKASFGNVFSIALAKYPAETDTVKNDGVAKDMALLQAVIGAARTIRAEHALSPATFVQVTLRTDNERGVALFATHADTLKVLVRSEGHAKVVPTSAAREAGNTSSVVAAEDGAVEVAINLRGHVTKDKELARVDREQKRIEKDLDAIEKKLSSKAFAERAPKEVVEEAHAQKRAMLEARERLKEARKLADELS
ncbi:MAG: valine--tRNA ligase [Polyangiaceae bacterium]